MEESCLNRFTSWLGVTLLLPFLNTPPSLSYLLRHFLQLIIKVKNDAGTILSQRAAVYAVDDIYESPKSVTLIHLVLDGVLTQEKLVQMISEKISQKRGAGSTRLLFPEFQQFVQSWYFYPFWFWDKSFNIHNHVKSSKLGDAEGLTTFMSNLYLTPFRNNSSPWELILIETEGKSEVTNLILRVHPVLGDVYDILDVFFGTNGGEGFALEKSTSRDSCAKAFWYLFTAPYQMKKILQRNLGSPKPATSPMNVIVTTGKLGDGNEILAGKDGSNFDLSTQIAIGISSLSEDSRFTDQKIAQVSIPVRIPKTPTQTVSPSFLSFSTDSLRNPRDLVGRIREQLRKDSADHIALFYLIYRMGCYPLWGIRIVLKGFPALPWVNVVNVPEGGANKQLMLSSYHVTQLSVVSTPIYGSSGEGVHLTSYNGQTTLVNLKMK